MIQQIHPLRSVWSLYWIDLDQPVPSGSDFFLPTIVIACDEKGSPLEEPQILRELDQLKIEDFLISLFERKGTPTRLQILQSEDWDESLWRRFSDDYRIEIRFTKTAPTTTTQVRFISQKPIGKDSSGPFAPANVAAGLLRTARSVRSKEKKIALLRKAIEIDPDATLARVELADIYFQAGNWKLSAEQYNAVVARDPGRQAVPISRWWKDESTRPVMRALMGQGMVFWQQGRYLDAVRNMEELLTRNPRDNQGARFFIPMLYLLADRVDKAAIFYDYYSKNYPSDFREPAFLFGWALCLWQQDQETESLRKYLEGIASNIYIAPMLLNQPLPPTDIWHPNDRAEWSYAQEFMDSYASLWDREAAAMRALREAHRAAQPGVENLIAHRRAMADFHDQHYDPDFKIHWQKLVQQDEDLCTKIIDSELS